MIDEKKFQPGFPPFIRRNGKRIAYEVLMEQSGNKKVVFALVEEPVNKNSDLKWKIEGTDEVIHNAIGWRKLSWREELVRLREKLVEFRSNPDMMQHANWCDVKKAKTCDCGVAETIEQLRSLIAFAEQQANAEKVADRKKLALAQAAEAAKQPPPLPQTNLA